MSGLLGQVSGTIEQLNTELIGARVSVTKVEAVLTQHEERRALAETERDLALAAWWEVADAGLFGPLLEIEEPDRRVVETGRETARAARRKLREGGDQAAEDRAWRKCVIDLQQLRQSLLPSRDITVLDDTEGSIPQVMVLADGSVGWQSPLDASEALVDRVRLQEEKYDAEQRAVLATLLESTFIEHLKERLDYTKETFALITRQLAEHPTRRGHVVRLSWAADPGDPEAGAVVTALGQGYKQLSPERQDQVRAFLSRKIDAARADAAADGVSDWREQLTVALDYRRWLRIGIQIRLGPDSPWRQFDGASHGAKSGGEKVVLLSQPLFAAAVVAYNAAGPSAPRWIWLDEAMTGVDISVKQSFMGLTVDFDLDVMLTAHDEWCTYPTVPAVAIYDLARHPQFPGVDAEAYVWSGGELTQAEPDR
ncbi:SbcC/MukB-like Walker B domain-containing protein [Kribbella sp. NPDC059898]|uniref:SbcC/MukB-like Walker B domain-containing protein n=1 Tax=Kribbella sp. NPDC059898 TaxID=3346995 RepID=UPI0036641331